MPRIKCMAVAYVLMVAIVVVQANQCPSGGECPSSGEPTNVVAMLQTKLQMNALEDEGHEETAAAHKAAPRSGAAVMGASVKAASGGEEACTALLNKYTHFAVEVAVGTPAQSFELVIDTGSDAVIVTSCLCVEDGYCSAQHSCFRGHNKSSTFTIGAEGNEDQVSEVVMSFGSGDTTVLVASDVVAVGGVQATLTDGLLLMVDRRKLNVSGPFDGILGLGPPKDSQQLMSSQGYLLNGQRRGSDPTDGFMEFHPKRFLKEAGVERFTVCFNSGPGVLRMNVPEFEKIVPSIGTAHWALGLHGVSVGSETAPAIVCKPSDVTDGQPPLGRETPCGAIPDSGTTLLTAPKDHVLKLFASLCESWPRCQGAQTGTVKNTTELASAFQLLVRGCYDWMDDDTGGIDEIPPIFFAVGSPSDPQKIKMTAWAYIVEIEEDQYMSQIEWTGIPEIVSYTGKMTEKNKKVCIPRIGADDFATTATGPVWLLGTPLFYQFTVGYDMQGPGISFQNGTCTACTPSASLVDGHKQLGQRVRTATEPPRVRKIDKSLPL